MDLSVGEPDPRVGELLDAYLRAVRDGRAPGRDAFVAAHPEVAPALRAALVGFDFVQRGDEGLSSPESLGGEAPADGTLGDFRLVREVGRGGMGVVYEAVQISLGRKVALKVLPFAAVLDDRQLQRFKHEAQSAALLHHTNIVPVYSVGTERGVHYYAMQFVEGRTLADVLTELRVSTRRGVTGSSAARARGRRPSPRAAVEPDPDPPSSAEALALTPTGTTETPDYCRAVARLGVQAADALDHAHANGVIHRDIKPANLMVDGHGHLWIADFGLARSLANPNLTMTGAIVGTIRYMSPEQALSKRATVDHRTDIYSLGVTLLEALTLEPAFPGDDAHAIIEDIASREPVRPHRLNPAVPAALETVLLKAVAKDPETRYATAREMADDLRRYLEDKPVVARSTPLLDRAALWAKRHREAVGAGAALLIVSVFVLGAGTVLVLAEKRETERHLEQSRRDAARAEANFVKAREAVDLTLTRIGDAELAGVPGLEVVRRKLLTDAVAFYEAFLDQHSDDPGVQLETARACHRLGRMHTKLADYDAAHEMFGRARALLAGQIPPGGRWSSSLNDLVDVESDRGLLLTDRGRHADALVVLENAVELAERNVRDGPGDVASLNSRANADRLLGSVLARLGETARAAEVLQRAAESHEALVERSPADATLRECLVRIYDGIAVLAWQTGKLGDAEEATRSALARNAKAVDAPADSLAFRLRAGHLDDLGNVLSVRGRFEEAERAFGDAAAAFGRIASEFPHFSFAVLSAAKVTGLRAALLWRLARTDEAAAASTDAVARFQRFADRFAGVPELAARGAKDAGYVANMLSGAGRPAEAESVYDVSVALRRASTAANPKSAQALAALAAGLSDMAAGLASWRTTPATTATLREAARVGHEVVALPESVRDHWMTLGATLNNLAISLEDEDPRGALEAYADCAKVHRDFASRFERGPGDRMQFATLLMNWGDLLRKQGRLEEAGKTLVESVGILERLAAESRESEPTEDALNDALGMSAHLAMDERRISDAEALYRRVLVFHERVRSANQGASEAKWNCAKDRFDLGSVLRDSNRPADAEQEYEKAMVLLRELAREDPGNSDAARLQGRCSVALAAIVGGSGRDAERGLCLSEAVRAFGRIASADSRAEDPGNLLDARVQLGLYLRKSGRTEESDRELAEALVQFGESDGADRIHLALAHARLGDLVQARALYDQAVGAMAVLGTPAEHLLRRTAEVAALLGLPAAR